MSSLMNRLSGLTTPVKEDIPQEQPEQQARNPLEGIQNAVKNQAKEQTSSEARRAKNSRGHPHHTTASGMGNGLGPQIGKGADPAAYNSRVGRNQATGLYNRINPTAGMQNTTPTTQRLNQGQGAAATTAQRLNQGSTQRQSYTSSADRLNQAQQQTPPSTPRQSVSSRLAGGQTTARTTPMAALGAELRNFSNAAPRNTLADTPIEDVVRESQAVPIDAPDIPTTDIQETSSGWGATMWTITGFAGLGALAAGAWYWFKRRFGGNTKPNRKLRRWELVRMVSTASDAFRDHNSYRPSNDSSYDDPRTTEAGIRPSMDSMGRFSNVRQSRTPRLNRTLTQASLTVRNSCSPRRARPRATLDPSELSRGRNAPRGRSATHDGYRQSNASYIEVPRASYEPSMWERMSKGGKLS